MQKRSFTLYSGKGLPFHKLIKSNGVTVSDTLIINHPCCVKKVILLQKANDRRCLQ